MPGRARRGAGRNCPREYQARVRWLRGAYEAALARELAGTAQRPDGCATIEDLDDAWHVGVAVPQVGEQTFLAWQALVDYLLNAEDAPPTWPLEAGPRPASVGPGRR